MKEIKLNRSIGKGKLFIHAFGNACGKSYACAIFARIESENGVNIFYLGGKSRIAPKNATIPRLELMAATITVRFYLTVPIL